MVGFRSGQGERARVPILRRDIEAVHDNRIGFLSSGFRNKGRE